MGYNVLDDDLTKLVQQVCRQFMNSFQPRPKRDWRGRRGGGASVDTGVYRGVVDTTVSAATGTTQDESLTPGNGFVRLYNPPQGTPIASTPWTRGDLVVAENWMHATIAIRKPVLLRKVRDTDSGPLYEVIAEGCAVVPDSQGGTG